MNDANKAGVLFTSSGVSHTTGEPFVAFEASTLRWQMTAEEAAELGRLLIHQSEAALVDAMLFKFAKERLGTDIGGAAHLVVEFRDYRESRNKS